MNNYIKYIILTIILISFFLFKDKLYQMIDSFHHYQNIDLCLSSQKDDYNELLTLNKLNIYNEEIIYTKVLYRDIYDFKKEITIYKGNDYQLKVNDLVLNNNGLVGIISKVDDTTSLVTLLTNKDIKISVKVANTYGILKYNNDQLIISNITSKEDLKLNDLVYTSGIGNLNGNYLIGYLKTKINNSLNNEYEVISYVNFNNLNYLYIVRNNK